MHAATQPGMGTDIRRWRSAPNEKVGGTGRLPAIPPSVLVDSRAPYTASPLPGALQQGRYAFWPKQLPGAASRKFRQPVVQPSRRGKGVAPIGAALGSPAV